MQCYQHGVSVILNRGDTTLTGTLMEEEDFEVRPSVFQQQSQIPALRVSVKRYFTCEAWHLVEEVVKAKSVNPQWMCPIGDKDADGSGDGGYTSLTYDSCLELYHLTCLGENLVRKQERGFVEVATQMLTHREYRYELYTFIFVWLSLQVSCIYIQLGFGVVLGTLYGLSLCSLNMGTYGCNLCILFY